MSYKAPHEVLSDYSQQFGSSDAPIVKKLTESASNLYSQWRTFLYLFSGPTERLDVLNSASGRTAILLQGLLWDSVLLRIRRMTDPMKSKKNDNLSLQHLARIADKSFGHSLDSKWEELRRVCEPAMLYVDKYLAHSDLHHSLGQQEKILLQKQTTEAILAIGNFVRDFHIKTRNVDIQLMPIPSFDDERMLLLRLYQGCKYAEESKANMESLLSDGKHSEALAFDFAPPDWMFKPYGF